MQRMQGNRLAKTKWDTERTTDRRHEYRKMHCKLKEGKGQKKAYDDLCSSCKCQAGGPERDQEIYSYSERGHEVRRRGEDAATECWAVSRLRTLRTQEATPRLPQTVPKQYNRPCRHEENRKNTNM